MTNNEYISCTVCGDVYSTKIWHVSGRLPGDWVKMHGYKCGDRCVNDFLFNSRQGRLFK